MSCDMLCWYDLIFSRLSSHFFFWGARRARVRFIHHVSCHIISQMCCVSSFIKRVILSRHLSNVMSHNFSNVISLIIYQIPCLVLSFVEHLLSLLVSSLSLSFVGFFMHVMNKYLGVCVCVCVNAGLRIQSDSWVNILCKVGEKDITLLLVFLSLWTYNVAFPPVTSRISRA